jgi:hypothetical protein
MIDASARDRLNRQASGALILLTVAAAIGYALPLTSNLASVDHDALAMLGDIRSHGRYCGWPVGFFFNAALTGAVVGVLNAIGASVDDYLTSYRIVVIGAWVGSGLLIFAATVGSKAHPSGAWAGMALLLFNPGSLRLLAQLEDNLIASAAQSLYLLGIVLLAGRLERSGDAPGRKPLLLAAGAGVLLALAVLSHHQMNIL